MLDKLINKIKEELYSSIESYGLEHRKTITLSQRLDVLIVKKQRRIGGNYKWLQQ